MVFLYMTGWRIGEPLALCWDDVSLDEGFAVTRHEDNKGKRDERVPLHPIVVEHLRKLVKASIGSVCVFPETPPRRSLYEEFAKIQDAAGIHLPYREKHEHTDACHRYGFHDLRRAFATLNAARMSGSALQALMRHKSFTTTMRYINMAPQLDDAVEVLHVPEVLQAKRKGQRKRKG